MRSLPSWVTKAIVIALIGAVVGGTFGWARSVSTEQDQQSKDIAVLQDDQKDIEDDIKEIKSSQRRMEDKIDRALERRR